MPKAKSVLFMVALIVNLRKSFVHQVIIQSNEVIQKTATRQTRVAVGVLINLYSETAKCLQPFSELNRLQVINHLPNATLNN